MNSAKSVLLVFSLLLLLAVRPTLSSFQWCDNWFERNVLCDSIDVQKEFSVMFEHKELTYCPDKCQVCMNYDAINRNRKESSRYPYNATMNKTCDSVGYDGYCYDDEEEYHLFQQNTLEDEDGSPSGIMPWEMQFFYYFAHCARDRTKRQNIWKTGESDKLYETIIRAFPMYSPTVLSRPEDSAYAREAKDHDTNVGVGPWLVQLEDFLTDEECDAMIAQTKIAIDVNDGGFLTLAEDEETEFETACQSTQAWCDPYNCMKDPILENTWKKIEELVGIPFDTYTEPVHFIQYVPGQKYGRHTDAMPEEYNSVAGPRLFTILFYLNDIADGNGGETCFPDIERSDGSEEKLCVQPKKGRALIWPNIRNELKGGIIEIPENRTDHEANGIQEGYKYASTVWYHLRDYSYADSIDCVDIYTDTDSYAQDFYGFGDQSHLDQNGNFNGGFSVYDDDSMFDADADADADDIDYDDDDDDLIYE